MLHKLTTVSFFLSKKLNQHPCRDEICNFNTCIENDENNVN